MAVAPCRRFPQGMAVVVIALAMSAVTLKSGFVRAAAPAGANKSFVITHLPDPGHAHQLEVRAIEMAKASGPHVHLHDLISLAEAQDPVAEYWLGRYYIAVNPRGTGKWEWGVRWLQDSRAKHCRRAAYQIYEIYSQGHANAQLVRRCLRQAAELGWPPAQYLLALQLLRGNTAQIGSACSLLGNAAQSHYWPAVKVLYAIAIDPNTSVLYRHAARAALQQAATRGWVPAYGAVAAAFLNAPHPVYSLALTYANLGAAGGNATSCWVKGHIYFAGLGVKKNMQRAFHQFTLASKAGVRNATVVAGAMLLYGQGTLANPALGISRLELGFRDGSGRAAYLLGRYFLSKHNFSAAEKWWASAIKLRSVPWAQKAMCRLGLLWVQRAKSVAYQRAGFHLIHRAAIGGIARAEYATGYFYCIGTGVAPNREKAIVWLKKAASGKGVFAGKAEKLLARLQPTASGKK